jgi:hypothetical protein
MNNTGVFDINEQYLDIYEERYRIYRDGRLYSIISGYYLTDHIPNTYKYLQNTLYIPHRVVMCRHRLVAEAFIEIPRPDIFNQVDHIDGDKTNNNYNNLRFCTPRLNALNTYSKSTHPVKGGNPRRYPAYIKFMKRKYRLGMFSTEEQANAVKDHIRHIVFHQLFEWHTRPLTILPPKKWKITPYGIDF